ncbi:MAG: stage 0 sporulation protein, partial [Clostridia bacterium]|nr:stage 0 sporulation protein [Clostridia bacterium]
DETKILGGIGSCGRPLCCNTHLPEFVPVSIKMAKEQNLSLNPTKISGVCGRLMCCLKHEEEVYIEANSKLPEVGDTVTTVDGLKGEVHSISVLKQIVRVVVELENDEKEARDYPVSDLTFKLRKKNDKVTMDDELKALELLEKEDSKKNKLEDE